MVKEAAIPPTGQPPSGKDEKSGSLAGNLVVKCPKCREILLAREWEKNLKVCSRCNFHFKLSAYERIDLLADPGSFVETDADMVSVDPLKFATRAKDDVQFYAQKLEDERQKVGLNEAVVSGYAAIENLPLALAVMDFRFIGGSMGSVVGEKITRAIELGIEKGMPVLICSASGGARMQEGLYSLMQMAKASAALAKLGEAKLPFFSLLTDPTTGGVTASFAMLGDVTMAEPGALICFAGPRVIEQNIYMKLPEGAVTSEFVLQHGMIDAVVYRRDLRPTLARLLRLYAHNAPHLTESLVPATVKIELNSADRRGESDGLRPGI
jgi:acetyl-CoA carboxylase carboxyl transferase subunit beta